MNKRILTVDLVSKTGLEVENIDLVESDSEDDDYHLCRKRGIPSRTAEIASRLSTFYSDVDRHTNICLHASTPMGKKRRRILTFHLSMICRGERQEDKVKCFISYAKPREMFCNVLLGAGLMELEPSAGHVICHPDTGIRLCRMADMCKDKHFIEPSEEQVQSLVRSLTERMFEADCPIRSIFLPIDLNECHWGLLVLDIVEKGDGCEERVLSFGDSLRFTRPLHIKKFFQAVVDGCFPPKKGTRWKFERKKLHVRLLEV
ncbi:hypothetical protein BWQ96_05553 [Gracilariopsis chorda]|uniref:Ubiquitin-like protease family profile domain-containing protein n=1 Tax=Gracilariopsis chorda TaxID=448386 RepID=A0A2V3IRE6_9FLOR|nr:hypothetical protein BWQ96_05553 [Gracilariopsis chorda]|eukprot:PXF44696.1 hypothetical protein BWQ96_05553 [Gracilariopsis chorda]